MHKCEGPGTQSTSTKEEMLKALNDMMVIRRMETYSGDAYRAKKIRGFCHLYSGQVSGILIFPAIQVFILLQFIKNASCFIFSSISNLYNHITLFAGSHCGWYACSV